MCLIYLLQILSPSTCCLTPLVLNPSVFLPPSPPPLLPSLTMVLTSLFQRILVRNTLDKCEMRLGESVCLEPPPEERQAVSGRERCCSNLYMTDVTYDVRGTRGKNYQDNITLSGGVLSAAASYRDDTGGSVITGVSTEHF